MKTLYLLLAVCLCLNMLSCTSCTQATLASENSSVSGPVTKYPTIDPIVIRVLPHKPNYPFVSLGTARVSKFNFVGIKRQKATVYYLLRKKAVSMGGDAIINIHEEKRAVVGTVISYRKTLV